jgi:hypothetical protein
MRERDTHICKRGRGRRGRGREERRKGREGRGEGRGGLGREESVQYKFQSELARFSTPRLSDVCFFFFLNGHSAKGGVQRACQTHYMIRNWSNREVAQCCVGWTTERWLVPCLAHPEDF